MKNNNNKWIIPLGLVIIAFLFAMVFPFIWIFITSFKTSGEIFGTGAFRIIPENPTLENYSRVLFEKGILRAIFNSFIVATVTTVYVIIVATFCSYAISRFHFRGKSILLGLVLAVSMFPQMVITGPIYNLFYKLDWLNSYFVVLPIQRSHCQWLSGFLLHILIRYHWLWKNLQLLMALQGSRP